MNKLPFKLDILYREEFGEHRDPLPDCCSCSICGWHGKVSECEKGIEDDGWESVHSYEIHCCPVCEDDGCIDDYFFCNDSEDEGKVK